MEQEVAGGMPARYLPFPASQFQFSKIQEALLLSCSYFYFIKLIYYDN